MDKPDMRQLFQQACQCGTVDELRAAMGRFGIWLNDSACATAFETLQRRRKETGVSAECGNLSDRELAQVAGGVDVLENAFEENDFVCFLNVLMAGR